MTERDPVQDVFYTEITAQPAALERAAAGLADQVGRLDLLAGFSGPVVLTGMGASYDACLAAASALGRAGVPSTPVNTAELLHFRLPALRPGTLVVAISQSGRSAELVRLAEALGTGIELVTITNGVGNPLAARAGVALDTFAGPEYGPSTGTFAATFPALLALVRVLSGADPKKAVAEAVTLTATAAKRADDIVATGSALAEVMAEWLGDRRNAVLVGRGTALAAADLGSLVLKEAARFAAECLDAAEFRHGPLELAGPDLAVAVVATEAATRELDLALAAEVAAHSGSVLLITPDGVTMPGVTSVAVGETDPLLAPAIAAIPFQLLAWRLALAGGQEPGRFLIGSKITTRE